MKNDPLTPPLAPPEEPLARLPEEWAEAMVRMGEPKSRGLQVFRWICERGVLDPEQMSDLPKALRQKLAEEGLKDPLTISQEHRSEDSTRKLLVRLADGKE